MAVDIFNTAGTGTGSSENGRITVKANRNTYQQQDPPNGTTDFTIANFDIAPITLKDRYDDPRYYQGDTSA